MRKILYGILSVLMSASLAFGCFFAFSKSAYLPTASTPEISDDTPTKATADGNWSDVVKDMTSPPDGFKTPYANVANISSAEGLAYFAKNINTYSGYYVSLQNEINISDHYWTPISGKNFHGTFDGQGHKIKGLTVENIENSDGQGNTFAGLFGVCGGARFTNLTVEGSVSKTFSDNLNGIKNHYVGYRSPVNTVKTVALGGFVGMAILNSDGTGIKFENCVNKVSINLVIDNQTYHPACYMGGFVGYCKGGTAILNNCTNNGELSYYKKQMATRSDEYWNTAIRSDNMPNQLFMGGMVGLMALRNIAYSTSSKASTYNTNSLTLAENCVNTGGIYVLYEPGGDNNYNFFLRFGVGGIFGGITSIYTFYATEVNNGVSDSTFTDDLKIVSCINRGEINVYNTQSNNGSSGKLAFTNMYFKYEKSYGWNYVENNDIVFTAGIGGILGTFFCTQAEKFHPSSATIHISSCINFAEISLSGCAGYVEKGKIRIYLATTIYNTKKDIAVFFTPPQVGGILGYVEDLNSNGTSNLFVGYEAESCLNLGDIYFRIFNFCTVDAEQRAAYGATGIGPKRVGNFDYGSTYLGSGFDNIGNVNYGNIKVTIYIGSDQELSAYCGGISGASDDHTDNLDFGSAWVSNRVEVKGNCSNYNLSANDLQNLISSNGYQHVGNHILYRNASAGIFNDYVRTKNPIYTKDGQDIYTCPGATLSQVNVNFYGPDNNKITDTDKYYLKYYKFTYMYPGKEIILPQHFFFLNNTDLNMINNLALIFDANTYVLEEDETTSTDNVFRLTQIRDNANTKVQGAYQIRANNLLVNKNIDINVYLQYNLPTYTNVEFYFDLGDGYKTYFDMQTLGYRDNDASGFGITVASTSQSISYNLSQSGTIIDFAIQQANYTLDVTTRVGYYVAMVKVDSQPNNKDTGDPIYNNTENKTYGDLKYSLERKLETEVEAQKDINNFFIGSNNTIKVYYALAPVQVKINYSSESSFEGFPLSIVKNGDVKQSQDLWNFVSSTDGGLKQAHKYGYVWNFKYNWGTDQIPAIKSFVDVEEGFKWQNDIDRANYTQNNVTLSYQEIMEYFKVNLLDKTVKVGEKEVQLDSAEKVDQYLKTLSQITLTVTQDPIPLTINYQAMGDSLNGIEVYNENVGGTIFAKTDYQNENYEYNKEAGSIKVTSFDKLSNLYNTTVHAGYAFSEANYQLKGKKYSVDSSFDVVWDTIFTNGEITDTEILNSVADKSITICAYFKLQQYNLTVSTSGYNNLTLSNMNGPILVGATKNGTYNIYYGQKVQLIVDPNISTERFLGWFYGKVLIGLDNILQYSYMAEVEYDDDNQIITPTINLSANFKTYQAGAAANLNKGIYKISSADDLLWLAEQVAGGISFKGCLFRQTADINMDGVDFMPIGVEDRPFSGIYDGNNFVIKNLKIDLPTQSNVGLFGYTVGAIIKKLTLVDGSVSGLENVGAIVGYATNTNFSMVNNYSCSVEAANVSIATPLGFTFDDRTADYIASDCAGLVGCAEDCNFVGCSSKANVVGGNQVAGLVGLISGGKIEQSYISCVGCVTNITILTNISGDRETVLTDTYCEKIDSTKIINKTIDANWITINGKDVLKIFYWAA